jgi:hypothetical protein
VHVCLFSHNVHYCTHDANGDCAETKWEEGHILCRVTGEVLARDIFDEQPERRFTDDMGEEFAKGEAEVDDSNRAFNATTGHYGKVATMRSTGLVEMEGASEKRKLEEKEQKKQQNVQDRAYQAALVKQCNRQRVATVWEELCEQFVPNRTQARATAERYRGTIVALWTLYDDAKGSRFIKPHLFVYALARTILHQSIVLDPVIHVNAISPRFRFPAKAAFALRMACPGVQLAPDNDALADVGRSGVRHEFRARQQRDDVRASVAAQFAKDKVLHMSLLPDKIMTLIKCCFRNEFRNASMRLSPEDLVALRVDFTRVLVL